MSGQVGIGEQCFFGGENIYFYFEWTRCGQLCELFVYGHFFFRPRMRTCRKNKDAWQQYQKRKPLVLREVLTEKRKNGQSLEMQTKQGIHKNVCGQ